MSSANAANTSPVRTTLDTSTRAIPVKEIPASVDDVSTVTRTTIKQPDMTSSTTILCAPIAPMGAVCVNLNKPTKSIISPVQQALVHTCLAIIEEYCKGNIMHVQATIQICGILPDDKFSTDMFTTYIEQLSETDRDWLITSV